MEQAPVLDPSISPPPLSPRPLGLEPSFGFGDRLGLATPGHVAALREAGGTTRGIFAQQSIREMTRTARSAVRVMDDARRALAAASFDGPWGADADHLKTRDDVATCLRAGFCMFTIDPSEHVDAGADAADPTQLARSLNEIRDQITWLDRYTGTRLALDTGRVIEFTEQGVVRAAVKYGRAINAAIELGRVIVDGSRELGRPCEIEISVDETDVPTSALEHCIVARELIEAGLPLVSLAPRFVGGFEKGVDYKGDLGAFRASIDDHAAIARELGPYKLSLHSGSDKLSIYADLARACRGCFHVKTAGTSYLEALRVVARRTPADFRRIVTYSRDRYGADRATYHVSAELTSVPAPDGVADDAELERLYLDRWEDVPDGSGMTAPGRQILHCTFGSVLTEPALGPLVMQVLREHADDYREVLREHFVRHLRALRAGMARA